MTARAAQGLIALERARSDGEGGEVSGHRTGPQGASSSNAARAAEVALSTPLPTHGSIVVARALQNGEVDPEETVDRSPRRVAAVVHRGSLHRTIATAAGERLVVRQGADLDGDTAPEVEDSPAA